MRNGLGKLRISLVQCFGLVTLFAIWPAVYKLKVESRRMRTELESYSAFYPVLIIDDFTKLNVLEEAEDWNHEIAWQIYVPTSNAYLLRVAREKRVPLSLEGQRFHVKLPPGRHRIVFRHFVPMRFKAGGEVPEHVYLVVDDEEFVLSRRAVTSSTVSRKRIPRKNLNGQFYEQSPLEPLMLLAPMRDSDLPWSLTLEPARR